MAIQRESARAGLIAGASAIAASLLITLSLSQHAHGADRYRGSATVTGNVTRDGAVVGSDLTYYVQSADPAGRIPLNIVFNNNHPGTGSYRAAITFVAIDGQIPYLAPRYTAHASSYTTATPVPPGGKSPVLEVNRFSASLNYRWQPDNDREIVHDFSKEGESAPMDTELLLGIFVQCIPEVSGDPANPPFTDYVQLLVDISGEVGIAPSPTGAAENTFGFTGRIPTVHLYTRNDLLIGPRPGSVDGTEEDLLSDCPCLENCVVGAVTARNNSVDVAFNVGIEEFQRPQELRIKSEKPMSNLSQPSGLEIGDKLLALRDSAGDLAQIVGYRTVIEVDEVSAGEYNLRYHHKGGLAADPETGMYPVGGSVAHTTINVKNPDWTPGGATSINRLRIGRDAGGSLEEFNYSYDSAQGSWTLEMGGGERTEVVSTTTDGSYETETRLLKGSGGGVISKRATTYWLSPFGRVATSSVNDPDGRALETTYAYYDDKAGDGDNYARLKYSSTPTGHWTHYSYDEFGRVTRRVSPVYLDQDGSAILGPPLAAADYDGTQDSQLKVIATTYDDSPAAGSPHVTTIETYLGHEVSRRYVRRHVDGEDVQVCQAPGAAFATDAQLATTSNLVTRTRKHIGGPFDREPISTFFPDGTASIHAYSLDADGCKVTSVSTGEPAADGLSIVDGTETTTVTDPGGMVLSEAVIDIATGLQLSRSEATGFDAFGRPTAFSLVDNDGGSFATSTINYDCCGIANRTDRAGIYTSYETPSDLVSSQTRLGIKTTVATSAVARSGGGRIESETRVAVDPAGNEIAGTSTLVLRSEYDAGGQLVATYAPPVNAEVDPAATDLGTRRLTTYQEDLVATAHAGFLHRTRTVTSPNPATPGAAPPFTTTTVSESFPDGRTKKISGTGSHHRRYEYGIETPAGAAYPMRFTKTILLKTDGTDSGEWTKAYTDMAGRNAITVTSSGATASQTYFANNPGGSGSRGKLASRTDPDGVTLLYAYDRLGRLEFTALDIDRDGEIDLAGPDRVARTTRSVGLREGKVILRSSTVAWTADGDGGTTAELMRVETRADGLETWTTSGGLETHEMIDDEGYPAGSFSSTRIYSDGTAERSIFFDGRLHTLSRYDDTFDAAAAADNSGALTHEVTYTYDVFGRPEFVTDARNNGTTTLAYYIDDSLRSSTSPDPDGAGPELPRTTTFTYNLAGARETAILPDSTGAAPKILTYSYHPTGELKTVAGARSYVLAYTYDFAGRVKTLTAGGGTTTWNYHADSGLLEEKLFADGMGARYTYTPAGRPETRTLARGLHRKITYGSHGQAELLEYFTDDSQTAPDPLTADVSYSYNRLGYLKTLTDRAGLHTFSIDANGLNELETISGGLLDGATIDPGFDPLQRLDSLTFSMLGSAPLTHSYRYDATGRYAEIAAGADPDSSPRATYTYHENSNLPHETVSKSSDGATRLTLSRSFDWVNRLTGTMNSGVAGASSPPDFSFGFEHNAAGQRERIVLGDGSYWQYQYDGFGQLSEAARHLPDNTPVASQTYSFGHDNIGNRTGSGDGSPTPTKTYFANGLNQYTRIDHTGEVWVTGEADPAAGVTVDGSTANRPASSAYFEKEVSVANSAGSVFSQIEVEASIGASSDSALRHARVPAASAVPGYDADGNLVRDAFYDYSWDGENRLVSIETRADVLPAGFARVRLEFAYDSGGRRIEKKVFGLVESSWQLARHQRFLYDGWNLLAEYQPKSDQAWEVSASYLWGKDLSGTLSGAGGTSGLLHLRDHASGKGYFVAYDGKGNVKALVDDETGETSAEYEYSPFGNLVFVKGEAAHKNPFRFSTRYHDAETGHYYYGYRFYNPENGTWLNRDPAGESGGVNLYGFGGADPINAVDSLGLALYAFDGTKNYEDQRTHVTQLVQAYPGRAEYIAGVGRKTEGFSESPAMRKLGGIAGLGGQTRIDEMYRRFLINYGKGDTTIDIIGFSRGAAMALEFANRLYEEGYVKYSPVIGPDPSYPGTTKCIGTKAGPRVPVEIRFMGLFDTVGSFGVGGNDVNIGYNLTIPPNVQNVAHAVAADELRPMFPLTRLGGIAVEETFPGDHSNIGGGHPDLNGEYKISSVLSRRPLLFVAEHGRKAGIQWDTLTEKLYYDDFVPHNLTGEMDWIAANAAGRILNRAFGPNSQKRTNLPPFSHFPLEPAGYPKLNKIK